jgi:hypothetical protein
MSASITGSSTNVYINNSILEVRSNAIIADMLYTKNSTVGLQTVSNVLIANTIGGTAGTLVVGSNFRYDDRLAQSTLFLSGKMKADAYDISKISGDTQFLFNNNGVLQGSPDFVYIKSSNTVVVNSNLVVNGNLTVVSSQNLVVNDPIIELGNTISSSSTSTGLVLDRPRLAGEFGNVFAGYIGTGLNKYAIGYTDNNAFNTTIAMNSNLITAKVYGSLEATANLTVGTSLLVADSGKVTVGISNAAPIHSLDVGSNLYVSDTGSNVLVLRGNVAANYLYGNGAYLTGMTRSLTLQQATDYGNTTSNTVQFTNPTTSFITSGNVGIGNVAPIADLQVTGISYFNGNVYVSPDSTGFGIFFSDAPRY